MFAPREESDPSRKTLDYARPVERGISAKTREVARRTAQRAAALAVVFFLGGIVAANMIARVNGSYGDETFTLLLFLLSFMSLAVWIVAFSIRLLRTEKA